MPSFTGLNSGFLNVSSEKIIGEIKDKGYYVFENALDELYIDSMLQEIDFNKIMVNTNDVGVVKANNIKYLTHCLASSEKAYNIITSKKILEICNQFFTSTYKLTNHRIYRTAKFQHTPWHTDNNKQKGKELSGKHDMPGLLCLIYLSDVDKNAFQFIQHSHKWSEKYDHEIYLGDNYVQKKYAQDILSFRMKKGAMILCDIHGIHRAEPFKDKNYQRTSLLFQIDQVGENNEGHGENNIVNTEYLKNVTPELMQYLGFGFKREYPAFPNSSIATMNFIDVLRIQRLLWAKALSGLTKNIIKSVVSAETITKLKRVKWNRKKK